MVEDVNEKVLLQEKQKNELENIMLSTDFLPILEQEALRKKLNVYVFENDELKNYYEVKHNNIGVALLASCEENAIYNLKNLRKCYLIKFE